jgi:hypothetical protein
MFLTMMYFLYLFLTRNVLDIFNCAPTDPSDGHTYLQVPRRARCRVWAAVWRPRRPQAPVCFVLGGVGVCWFPRGPS